MKVLVACEYSGTVRDAFIKNGHDAVSCDLLPTDSEGPHIQGNVVPILNDSWDLIAAFPPCTYLCGSGMHWTKRGLRDPQLTEDALDFVRKIFNSKCDKIALENPVGCISTRIRPPDQMIQPWMYGEDASKRTCLWLKGLPRLEPSKIIPPKDWALVRHVSEMEECPDCTEPYCELHNEHYAYCECIGPTEEDVTFKTINGVLFGTRYDVKPVWGNQTPSGQNKLGPSKDRWKIRSKTYSGIGVAMANQWGRKL